MSRTAAEGGPFGGAGVVSWLRDRGVYVAFAALVLFNAVFTNNFATGATFFNLLVQVSPVLIVSLGMALVIGTEGIDLSVGSVMALAAAVVPLYMGYGPVVAIVIALVVGTLAGALNGSLVAFVGMQPIIATLALFVGGRGLAQVLVGGQLQIVSDPAFLALGQSDLLGIPVPVIIAAALALAVGLVIEEDDLRALRPCYRGEPGRELPLGAPCTGGARRRLRDQRGARHGGRYPRHRAARAREIPRR